MVVVTREIGGVGDVGESSAASMRVEVIGGRLFFGG